MARTPVPGPAGRRPTSTTPDELVRHLREAGAKRVYFSRADAFRDETIALVATYAFTPDETPRGSGPETVREMLTSVFEGIDGQLRFHDREWSLDWDVEPAFTDHQADLCPLYDRNVERKYGDGFNLRALLFAYEAFHDTTRDSRGGDRPR